MELTWNKNIKIRLFSSLTDVAEECKPLIEKGDVGFSGGSTYLKLFRLWAASELNPHEASWYPVDERVVPFESDKSNWGNAWRTLFSHYNKDKNHHFTQSGPYEEALIGCDGFKTLFLGIGDDGHTASLFSPDEVFGHGEKKVIETTSPKAPFKRISLTGDFIIKAEQIVIVFTGENKSEICRQVLCGETLPVTVLLKEVKNGTIFLDEALYKESS